MYDPKPRTRDVANQLAVSGFWDNTRQGTPYQSKFTRWILEPTYVGQHEKLDYVLTFPNQTNRTNAWPAFFK